MAPSIAVALLSLAAGAVPANAPAMEQPNVIVIVLDDLGTDKLKFYGETDSTCPPEACPPCPSPTTNCAGPYPFTPSLNTLRHNGIRFTRAYAMPVCSPTRACIQTGRYGFRTGVGNITSTVSIPGDYEVPDSEVFLAELLRFGFQGSQGVPYRCGAFGKWHMTTTLAQDQGHAVENGYEHFAGTMGNVSNFYRYDKVVHDSGSVPGVLPVDGRSTTPPFGTDTWHASVTTRDALAWINAQPSPFFAYVGYGPPHAPIQVPPADLLPLETLCEIACAGLEPGDFLSQQSDPPYLVKLVYRAMIEALDAEIGMLLNGLSVETRANTMVFVFGDNGTPGFAIDEPPHEAGHGKGQVYDLGTRVPLIVSGPMVKTPIPTDGWTSDALVSAVDLWRTIADVAGADPVQVVDPAQLDSISFLPVIREPLSAGGRAVAFSQLFSPNGVLPLPPPSCYSLNRRSVTDGEFKLVRSQVYLSASPCGTPWYSEKLYHLPSDPEETRNLLALGAMSRRVAAHLGALRAEMTSLSGL